MILGYSKLFSALFVLILFCTVAFAGGQGDGLDEFSLMCLRCHSAPASLDPHRAGGRFFVAGRYHLVGLDYANRAKTNPALTPPDALDGALKLIRGRVSCITCHVPYATKSKHVKLSQERKKRGRLATKGFFDPMLVLDNSQSALCRKCHKK